MTPKNYTLKIAHLYPDLLNIYGDKGNITAIKHRCAQRDIDVFVEEIRTCEKINACEFDMFFIGGGQDGQQIMAAAELQKNKSCLEDAKEKNKVFLAICGGYQLLGKFYQPWNGERLNGIGLLDVYTVAGKKRYIGNVSGISPYFGTIAGFENHSGLTFLEGETKPLVKLYKGGGNDGHGKKEGAREKNVFGTYLHGPVLPKNPVFCDYLIGLALKTKYMCEIELKNIDDTIELKAHNYALKLQR